MNEINCKKHGQWKREIYKGCPICIADELNKLPEIQELLKRRKT